MRSTRHAPRLANPIHDAADIGAPLGRLGFAVTKLENAGKVALERGLQTFSRAASGAEAAMVFYAGHGIEVDKRNFLVPVDARLLSDREVEFETVLLDLVGRAVEGASGLGLVILDACRDNPFAASMRRTGAKRSIGRGLARVEPSGEMLVAYAAKEGTLASDGAGRNSPYTRALLAHLEEPGLEVGLMFRKVRDAVLEATGNKQEPFVYGSLSSKGAYLGARPEPPTQQAKPAQTKGGDSGSDRLNAERVAAEAYKAAERIDTIAAYEAIIRRFPRSIYAALSTERIRKHKGGGTETLARAKPAPGKPAPPTSAVEAEAALGLTSADRSLIQRGLSAAGFDPGPADGAFGPPTRAALRAWQAKSGAAVTGRLTLALGERAEGGGREGKACHAGAGPDLPGL